MTTKDKGGPCGYTLEEVIAMAGRFAKQLAVWGVTSNEARNTFFTGIGKKLTDEFHRQGIAHDLAPYEQRMKTEVSVAFPAIFNAGLVQVCADIRPFSGAEMEKGRLIEAFETVLRVFDKIRMTLKVTPSETLDLLVWLQCVLGFRLALDNGLILPESAVAKPAPKRSRHAYRTSRF